MYKDVIYEGRSKLASHKVNFVQPDVSSDNFFFFFLIMSFDFVGNKKLYLNR